MQDLIARIGEKGVLVEGIKVLPGEQSLLRISGHRVVLDIAIGVDRSDLPVPIGVGVLQGRSQRPLKKAGAVGYDASLRRPGADALERGTVGRCNGWPEARFVPRCCAAPEEAQHVPSRVQIVRDLSQLIRTGDKEGGPR